MNIDMRVCHFYVRAAELPRDVFQHIVIYVPVVAARRPETERVADRAVAIAGEAGEDGLKIHTLGVLRSADERFFDRIRRCVIAGLHDDFNAPEGVSGDVCDLRGGDLAVRKVDKLVVWGGDLRVEHTDLPHGAGFSADLDKITDLEGMRCEQHNGAGEIRKRILNGKRDGQTCHA